MEISQWWFIIIIVPTLILMCLWVGLYINHPKKCIVVHTTTGMGVNSHGRWVIMENGGAHIRVILSGIGWLLVPPILIYPDW